MTKQYLRFTCSLALGLTLMALSCSSTTDCDSSGTCAPAGGSAGTSAGASGGSGGSGGNSGNGGHSGGGGHSGNATGGTAAGTAGDSQAGAENGGAPPCDGACGDSTPVCNPATNSCVECVDPSQCAAPKPACDATTNTCVECTGNTDCKDAAKPFCDTTAEKCVACLQQSDCKGPAASKCSAGACAPCTTDAECSNVTGKGVCDAGTCVQCTGKKFAACGMDTGTPLVCDSLKRTCTTSKQHSAGLCKTCVSDAHCNAGEVCVLDKFGTPMTDVGYFCHWKQGDVANGAPADCTVGGQPYFGVQQNAVSIDGETSNICTLRKSTCVARNQFSSKNCTTAAAPNDALCGFSPTKDSKCEQVGSSSTYLCTMTCIGDPDCPGTACNTGASPPVCLLQ